MADSKRVIFTFDERSMRSLEEIKEAGNFRTFADTVRSSLQINRALQDQVGQGFTEVVVRNPETHQEKVLIIPTLTTNKK